MIDQCAVSVDIKRSNLLQIAKTCISSKILGIQMDFFTNLVVDAVLSLFKLHESDSSIPYKKLIKKLHIQKITGKSIAKSQVLEGILIQKQIPVDAPSVQNSPRILLCKLELSSFKMKVNGTKIKIESHQDAEEMSLYEREQLRKTCKQIKELSVNVVFNNGIISTVSEQFFTENGIIAIGNVDLRLMDMLGLALGCPIYSNLDSKTIKLGSADCVEQISLADTPFIQISGCKWCSVVLRAPNSILLEECERSLHDAICVLFETIKCRKIIGGAGSMYFQGAKVLRERDHHLSIIFKAFADALEAVPMIVLQNCGHDPCKILDQIQKEHLDPEGLWKGINVKNGKNMTSLEQSKDSLQGILEPASVMQSIVRAATDAAEMIIRIDTTVLIEPKKTPEELGLF